MKNTLIALVALAALALFPGCRHMEKHHDDPRCHTHRVRAGRPSPAQHHHGHGSREMPPPPPAPVRR